MGLRACNLLGDVIARAASAGRLGWERRAAAGVRRRLERGYKVPASLGYREFCEIVCRRFVAGQSCLDIYRASV